MIYNQANSSKKQVGILPAKNQTLKMMLYVSHSFYSRKHFHSCALVTRHVYSEKDFALQVIIFGLLEEYIQARVNNKNTC